MPIEWTAAGDSDLRPQLASWPYVVTLRGHILIDRDHRFPHNHRCLKDLSLHEKSPRVFGKVIAMVVSDEIDGPRILYL